MNAELLDKIDSAISHGRPKDARRLLTELRGELAQSPAPAANGNGAPPAAKPAAATGPAPALAQGPHAPTLTIRGHQIRMRETVDSGIAFECAVPPRPGDRFVAYLSTAQVYNVFMIETAIARCEKSFDRLCKQFKDWDLARIP